MQNTPSCKLPRRFWPLFYLLSCSWGGIPTLVGALLAIPLLLTGHKPQRIGPCIYFCIGKNWGGCELGLFFLRDRTSHPHTTYHEAGHSLQNMVLGPLMLPIISFPSTLRYHYRNFLKKFLPEKAAKLPPYDAIWFEAQASRLGYRWFAGLPYTPPAGGRSTHRNQKS